MRAVLRSLTTLCVVLVCVGTGWAQSSITLVADADTSIRENWPNQDRSDRVLECRSYNYQDISGRQQVPYIRFDLRVLQDAPPTGTVFSIVKSGSSQGFAAGQVSLYGLKDDFGNTPQAWLDSGLVYNTSGWEIPGDDNGGTQDIDTNRVVFIADFPAAPTSNLEETLSIANSPALDAFVSNRWANGGLATLLLVQEFEKNRTLYFNNTENTDAAPPTLGVVGLLQGIPPDTEAPEVVGTSPLPGATDVAVFTEVNATFSESMDEASITNGTVFFLLDGSSSTVSAAVVFSPGSFTLTLTPDSPLDALTTYTATVLAGVTDANGNVMTSDFSWTFTTEDADVIPPTVVEVIPTNGQVDVDFYTKVHVIFSETMDPSTITTNTMVLEDASGQAAPVVLTYDAETLTAILSPTDVLTLGKTYTTTVVGGASGVTDLVGNPMAADYVWTFTVTPYDPIGPVTLLAEADTYSRSGVDAGASQVLDVRSFSNPDWGEFFAYVRFDLTGFAAVQEATFTLRNTAGQPVGGRHDTIVTGRHQVFGLTDDAGNTAQDWDESSDLVLGAEYTNTGGNGVDTNQVFVLDADLGASVTETVPGGHNVDVSISGPDLVTFLNERIAAGGWVTFIVRLNDGGSKGYAFAAKESVTLDPPRLTVTGSMSPPITGVGLAAGPSVVVTWDALATHSYGVERTEDGLVMPDWVGVASNLSGGTVNTFTDTVPVTASASYRVVDEGAAEFFFDDFEGDDMGWTTVTGAGHNASTEWNVDAPSIVGPSAAFSGTKCYGTNLDDYYYPNADIGLRTPVIDLTGAAAARLTFAHYYDIDETGDFGYVYVRDASGGELVGLESPIATYTSFVDDWVEALVNLPTEALGQPIRLEFRMSSDGSLEFPGWYIDDVKVSG